MRTANRRRGCRFVAIAALIWLMGCTMPREPAYDPEIVSELTELAHETGALFQALAPPLAGTYQSRRALYDRLHARAGLVALLATTREVFAPAPNAPEENAGPGATTSAVAANYQTATVGFMTDYRRNLDRLAVHDRGVTGDHSPAFARFERALSAHEEAIGEYRHELRLWRAGAGPRPDLPTAAPEPPVIGLSPTEVTLRWTQIQDILRDALIYEREILNRTR